MSLRLSATRLLRSRRYYCDKLWASLSILWNGDLEPCPCACGDTPFINMLEQPFLEAWNSEPYRKSRAYLLAQLGLADGDPVRAEEAFDICRNCSVPLVDRYSVIRWRAKGMGAALRWRALNARGPAERAVMRRKILNYTGLLRELRHAGPTVRHYPILGNIDASNLCNLRCPMCRVGTGEINHPRGMMSMEDYRRIMSEVGPGLVRLEFYRYGEPLLNPQIAEMVRIASREYLCHTQISSNLSLPLSDEAILALAESGLDTLVVAADGPDQETYEKYRRSGSIEQVLDNLSRIAKTRRRAGAKRPHIVWQYLVFSHNENRVEETRALALRAGADRFVAVEPSIPQYDDFASWTSTKSRDRGYHDEPRHRQILDAKACPAHGDRIEPGASFRLTARVRNTTAEIWAADTGSAGDTRLGVKLYAPDGGDFLREIGRGLLESDVAPGGELTVEAVLAAPATPGRHRLKLDMVREHEYWHEWKTGHKSEPQWVDLEVG